MTNQIHGKQLLQVNVQGQIRNLVVLRGNGSTRLFEAHPLVEGFNARNGTNLKVVSHKVADVAQTVGDTWRSLPAVHPVDVSIAYEKPDTNLGKEIVFAFCGKSRVESRVVLATGKYKGKKDVALVALGVTSADFQKDGNSLVLTIPDSRLIAVPNFPDSDGWYMPHAKTGVPHGGQVSDSSDASRHLYRLNDSSYVGLLARGRYIDYDGRRNVFGLYWPDHSFGVVAEVPDADVAKLEALLKPAQDADILPNRWF